LTGLGDQRSRYFYKIFTPKAFAKGHHRIFIKELLHCWIEGLPEK